MGECDWEKEIIQQILIIVEGGDYMQFEPISFLWDIVTSSIGGLLILA